MPFFSSAACRAHMPPCAAAWVQAYITLSFSLTFFLRHIYLPRTYSPSPVTDCWSRAGGFCSVCDRRIHPRERFMIHVWNLFLLAAAGLYLSPSPGRFCPSPPLPPSLPPLFALVNTHLLDFHLWGISAWELGVQLCPPPYPLLPFPHTCMYSLACVLSLRSKQPQLKPPAAAASIGV